MKFIDNYILMETNKRIVICFFSVISFLSLVRTQDHFKKLCFSAIKWQLG